MTDPGEIPKANLLALDLLWAPGAGTPVSSCSPGHPAVHGEHTFVASWTGKTPRGRHMCRPQTVKTPLPRSPTPRFSGSTFRVVGSRPFEKFRFC